MGSSFPPKPLCAEVTAAINRALIRALIMKIELFAGHREARQALVLSVAGVTAIMLIANLILMAGIETQSPTHRYWKEKGHQTSGGRSSSIERPSPEGAVPNSSQFGR